MSAIKILKNKLLQYIATVLIIIIKLVFLRLELILSQANIL